MNNCTTIVVTYNRKSILEENINALLNQTYSHSDILIIDNASTDGTDEMIGKFIDKRIKYHNTGANLGGAGGFAVGLKLAIESGYKYGWVMDDDAIPEPNALESLIKKAHNIKDEFSFMASLVYWTDNNLFDMNIPNFKFKPNQDMNLAQKLKLISELQLIPISTCSFVGCFINLETALEVGLPISEFFIYGDDTEYTQRLLTKGAAFLDLDSKIVHKAPSNTGADIVTANFHRIDRFFYQSRNGVYIAKKSGGFGVLIRFKIILKRFLRILRFSPDNKVKRCLVLLKGTFVGFFFNPEIKYAVKKSK